MSCGFITTPLVRDPGGDHRHLQRRHEQPLLAEGEAARVDLRLGSFGSKSLRVAVVSPDADARVGGVSSGGRE